jgi:hypothetical protein
MSVGNMRAEVRLRDERTHDREKMAFPYASEPRHRHRRSPSGFCVSDVVDPFGHQVRSYVGKMIPFEGRPGISQKIAQAGVRANLNYVLYLF